MYTALAFLVTQLGARTDRARREEGASAVEWVVIAAVLVAVCGAIAAILVNALTSEANDIGNDIQNP